VRYGILSSVGEPNTLTEAFSDPNWHQAMEEVKEYVPPCVVLVINDNPYRLMFVLSFICRTCL
jgi:hypothetical protein